jgi:hypothetical protein
MRCSPYIVSSAPTRWRTVIPRFARVVIGSGWTASSIARESTRTSVGSCSSDRRLQPGPIPDAGDDDDLVALGVDVLVGQREVLGAPEQDRPRRTLATRARAHRDATVDGEQQRPDSISARGS